MRHGKAFFVIEVTKRSPEHSQAVQTRPKFVILRSYSEFRLVRKALLHLTRPYSKHNRLLGPFRRELWGSGSCVCRLKEGVAMEKGIILCPFHSLHQHLESLHFPSRKPDHLYSTRQQFLLQESRRKAFNAFLGILQWNFAQFPSETLDEAVDSGDCCIANACMEFLNMNVIIAEKLRSQHTTEALRAPLQLTSWWVEREHLASCMEIQDHVTSDSFPVKTRQNELEAFNKAIHVSSNEKTLCTSENLMHSSHQMHLLPTLKIQPMLIDSAENVLEDYCDHLLQQYGHHIEEVQHPELSEARRWELSLYVASWVGHLYAVQMILFYHSNPNVLIRDGTTCLHVAARMGHSSVLSALLREGAHVNAPNSVGVTALVVACRHGQYEIAKLLLEAGADTSIASFRGTYPLHAAIVAKSVPIVRLLISHGANVNVLTSNGITPLHFAAKLGSAAICRLLLQQDADVHLPAVNGDTALTVAKTNGQDAIYRTLQQHAWQDPLQ
uniref:Uncharacterized protein AlNc14C5G796 n=1 Tax=Albugo laibachii Nc14 TaxID=890382 RepID=F0W116_9STRA|nr:conserved hypothetical protein [Albugo laibachii Nc14]|eukprot:CCA14740.1 conserved hypothetical protein [Albugo laibachii Nc14]